MSLLDVAGADKVVDSVRAVENIAEKENTEFQVEDNEIDSRRLSTDSEREIARLMELQRLEQQKFYSYNSDIDGMVVDDLDSDFGDARTVSRPAIPEMRFEQQFNQNIAKMEAEGASYTRIFLSAVIKDQLIVPFMSGLTWSLGSHLWLWYRTPSPRVARRSSPFLLGLRQSIKTWCSNVYNTMVHFPALTQVPHTANEK
ncbi:hypothetical protein J3Q64DRAFT_1745824 [Phycomyces blakesleeanus]|uniref:Uncharacterized protein n=1 Tax=Phycomyces blakesleeanus TaxID=4837 RepID=A0ABR3AYB4_PHYBL